MSLEKIISGGQTGADRAALEAAHLYGLKTGGWAPPCFMTSEGRDYSLRDVFNLKQLKYSSSLSLAYIRRSQLNVDESDATVVFKIHASPGTDKTIGYCRTRRWTTSPSSVIRPFRPVLIITNSVKRQGVSVEDWQRDLQSTKDAIVDLIEEFEHLYQLAVEPIERLRQQQTMTTNSSIFAARENLIERRIRAASRTQDSIRDLKQLLEAIDCEINKSI